VNFIMFDKPYVVTRDSLPEVHSIEIDGVEHSLGLVKDFLNHPVLQQFLQNQSKASLSWASLKYQEVLDIHQHPVDTLVILCKGKAQLIGDVECLLHEGDIVAIPRHSLHGLVGTSKDDMWCIAVSFSDAAIYNQGMTTK
jgi:quercetin dioxygenase-like cupin family protein